MALLLFFFNICLLTRLSYGQRLLVGVENADCSLKSQTLERKLHNLERQLQTITGINIPNNRYAYHIIY